MANEVLRRAATGCYLPSLRSTRTHYTPVMPHRIPDLARLASEIAPRMIDVRRDLHQNPEVGWNEHRTTRKVADALIEWGIEPQIRPEGTGLIADIGEGPPTVGFRADLDALPIAEEATPVENCSIFVDNYLNVICLNLFLISDGNNIRKKLNIIEN